jgi:hypothetical protein
MTTSQQIRALIAAELTRMDPGRREVLQRHLVEPQLRTLRWDYGPPDCFECWIVGHTEDEDERFDLAYCESGFGPDFPWGCVFSDDSSMGMDAQWSSGLEDAAISARILAAPPGYQVPGPRR